MSPWRVSLAFERRRIMLQLAVSGMSATKKGPREAGLSSDR
ncbi:hypothetical protein EL18_02046 [Nitratireductor basaltis]|uniref:Uncharacterized protein n=1 Tax=Nitratireductor basaltis TaxID=472175 RepID=A0A084UDG9_9HYPH|nr:hypothetical protein EL18_02046 [Nitratireductor basaltis]